MVIVQLGIAVEAIVAVVVAAGGRAFGGAGLAGVPVWTSC